MWKWDQGHLEYFQFDAIRQIASFVAECDFKQASRTALRAETGLSFSAPATHGPWRNYSRALKLCLLVSEQSGKAQATPVAHILAQPGAVTCDEYLHFLARAFTSPSPALQGWEPRASFRYPLLFALKYLLTKSAITDERFASVDEIIGAYRVTGFAGDEDEGAFIGAVGRRSSYEARGQSSPEHLRRQARESLKVIAQISYLYIKAGKIIVSLNPVDAKEIFEDLAPIIGPRAPSADGELRRLANLFRDGSTSIAFGYSNTIIDEIVESGFQEGSKVKRTHVTIERNGRLRKEFFAARPSPVCDVCRTNTARSYPWTERVMDLHHLLPLSSGTRVEATGTTFNDLVPVCPSCHRAIHRYYDKWLSQNVRKDFKDSQEARNVYGAMKSEFPGLVRA